MLDQKLYDRILKYVRKDESGCWLWTGYVRPSRYPGNRYGMVTIRFPGKTTVRNAHRAMWAALHGWPERSQVVCHTCDVALCVNPEHIYLGTMADNMRDRDERNRNHNTGKVYCKRGHLLEGDRIYLEPSAAGGVARKCKQCMLGSQRIRKQGWPEDLAYSLPPQPKGVRSAAVAAARSAPSAQEAKP